MSYLYIPDEDSDSVRYTDRPDDQDGQIFRGTWFNPTTGELFRVVEIDDDLVRVSAIVTLRSH